MDGTMRVLYVHTATQAPLGADTWVHAQILRHLDRHQHELVVACQPTVDGRPTPTYEAIRDIDGIEIIATNLGREVSGRSGRAKLRALASTLPAVTSFVRLLRLARRDEVAIVHTSDRPRDAFVAVVVARFSRARSIVHVHVGYDPTWMGRLLRWSLWHADALIAVSHFVASTLTDAGIAPERVHVVHNGIDPAAWREGGGDRIRDELAIAEADPVVVTVCRLFPEKGPAELIRAIARVRDAGVDVVLLVVGQAMDPAYRSELSSLVGELGLTAHVRFLGRREDVAAVMSAADVYAMPSHDEPFGLVFLEAMAVERPVVGLDDGGTVEVVVDGETGLLSRWHDIEGLTDNLLRLLTDAPRRTRLGTAGRRRVQDHFTVQHLASRTAAVYRLVACSPRNQRAGAEGRSSCRT